jgi:hypothetical protein
MQKKSEIPTPASPFPASLLFVVLFEGQKGRGGKGRYWRGEGGPRTQSKRRKRGEGKRERAREKSLNLFFLSFFFSFLFFLFCGSFLNGRLPG